LAPARTPKDIIARLNEAAARAIQAETFKKLALNEGLIMVAQSSESSIAIFGPRKSTGAK
jgi:tripartite-type tricarboxylate transporter receptor subunit TctC